LDQERSRHPAEGHSRQQPLKFQTEWNTTLASLYQRKLAALDELKKSLLHQAFSGAL
jgi:type I restriction enzyme S subunit